MFEGLNMRLAFGGYKPVNYFLCLMSLKMGVLCRIYGNDTIDIFEFFALLMKDFKPAFMVKGEPTGPVRQNIRL